MSGAFRPEPTLTPAQLAFLDFVVGERVAGRPGYAPALWARHRAQAAGGSPDLGLVEATEAIVELTLACEALEEGRASHDQDLPTVLGDGEAQGVVAGGRDLARDRGDVDVDLGVAREPVDADGAAGRQNDHGERSLSHAGHPDDHLERLARIVVAKAAPPSGFGEVRANGVGPLHGTRSSQAWVEGDDRGREGVRPLPAPPSCGQAPESDKRPSGRGIVPLTLATAAALAAIIAWALS